MAPRDKTTNLWPGMRRDGHSVLTAGRGLVTFGGKPGGLHDETEDNRRVRGTRCPAGAASVPPVTGRWLCGLAGVIRLGLVLVVAALVPASADAQERVGLTLPEAREVATRALLGGDPRLALDIAGAIVQAHPDDRGALLIVAAAAPRVGEAARGQRAGARAWRLSQTAPQRYEAARLTALAASEGGRLTTASFWLRLALVSAPDAAQEDRTLADARAVARRNPLQLRLSLSLAPSSNVNGGAQTDLSTAPGNPAGSLSQDALALAGWRGTVGLGASYRLSETPQSRTTAGIDLQAARVWITEDTMVPDGAFDTTYAEARLRHERVVAEGLFGLALTRGQFNYRDIAGDIALGTAEAVPEAYRLTRLSADYQRALSDDASLQVSIARERLAYDAPGIGDVDRLRGGATLGYALQSGDVVTLGFDIVDSTGDNPNYTSTERGLRAGYRWDAPLGPVTVAASGGYRWADYPDYSLLFPVTGGRRDETVFATIDLGFPQAAFAGFIPGLRIEAARTDSNVSRFDRDSLGARLTITSSF